MCNRTEIGKVSLRVSIGKFVLMIDYFPVTDVMVSSYALYIVDYIGSSR